LKNSTFLATDDAHHPPAVGANPSAVADGKPSRVRAVFFGSDGLRAGWSLLAFIALIAALLLGVKFVATLAHVAPPPHSGVSEISPLTVIFSDLSFLIATLLVTWVMSKVEGRRMSVYGMGRTRALPRLLAGLALGAGSLSLLVLVLWKAGFLVFDGRLLFGGEAARYAAIWFLGFFVVGLSEEYLARGYILFTLTRGFAAIYDRLFRTRHGRPLGFWTAALLMSLFFGLGHGRNPGESPIGLLTACLSSLVFCLSLWRTGSLWWAIGFHASWDWAQSFVYGVRDSGYQFQHHLLATHPLGEPLMSGGATGPEGSLFVLGIFALTWPIIMYTLPRTGYGDTPVT
jgi:membrane protease YdiL (CAAX protease family)